MCIEDGHQLHEMLIMNKMFSDLASSVIAANFVDSFISLYVGSHFQMDKREFSIKGRKIFSFW